MDILWTVLGILLGLGVLAIVAIGICCAVIGGNCSKYEDAAYYASLAEKHGATQTERDTDKNTIEKGKEDNGSCNDWK